MVPQKIKENPIKSALAIIVSITSLILFLFKCDDRYAKAADLDEINGAIQVQQTEIVNEIKIEQYQIQIEEIEDEVFEIDTKIQNNTASPTDRAMKERKLRKITRFTDKINSLK